MENSHLILQKKIYEIDDIDNFLMVAQDKRFSNEKIAKLEREYLDDMRESAKLKIHGN